MTGHFPSRNRARGQARPLVKVLLFVYVLLVACPIRYWPVALKKIDDTWVFALNYAAAHGLAVGRDVVWTTGPLGYLVFPQDIGGNLAIALAFQTVIWGLMSAILADLFFRSGISLRSLAVFSIFFGLSAPWYWFNYMGVENLLIAGVLILLVLVRLRGGTARYVTALVIIGVIPLIKVTGGVIAGGALAGYLLDRVIRTGWKAWREAVLGAGVPVLAAGLTCWLTLPSIEAFRKYVTGSLEIAGGYSMAMSLPGGRIGFVVAAEILILLGALIVIQSVDCLSLASFFALLLAVPLMISLKHGYVRQDVHIANFLGFSALAMGLIALQIRWVPRSRLLAALTILLPFLALLQDHLVPDIGFSRTLSEVSGTRALTLAWDALFRYASVRQDLRTRAEADWRALPGLRLESEIRTIIGDSLVASLSIFYSAAYLEGLNLRLYPVVQRYSAYTSHLDRLNATWICDHGPRFLLFDGYAIDGRDLWAETPATWLEVYRWYNTRLLGSRNLLLERRPKPRFQRLESIARLKISTAAGLRFPPSDTPVFWTMTCALSPKGKMQKLLFRVRPVAVVAKTCSGVRDSRRVVMDVLSSPVMGNFLPGSLAELSPIFEGGAPACTVDALTFEGALHSYSESCDVELLRPVPDLGGS